MESLSGYEGMVETGLMAFGEDVKIATCSGCLAGVSESSIPTWTVFRVTTIIGTYIHVWITCTVC